jgi:N-acetylglucosamine-6-phosphate deacetylase
MDTPGLTVSFIVDEIHVSSALLRLAHRALKSDRIYYTTDAMAAAAAPPGRHRLGALEVQVGPDQVVRKPNSPHFAGSALRPIEGIQRAARILDRSWQEVWPHFSTVPARMMGLGDELAVGRPACFCLLEVSSDNCIQRLQPILTLP